MAKIKRNPAALKIADLIFENYDLKNANDANEALKEVFGPLFEKMLNAEMDAHLGYDKNSQDPKETENRRNREYSYTKYYIMPSREELHRGYGGNICESAVPSRPALLPRNGQRTRPPAH